MQPGEHLGKSSHAQHGTNIPSVFPNKIECYKKIGCVELAVEANGTKGNMYNGVDWFTASKSNGPGGRMYCTAFTPH